MPIVPDFLYSLEHPTFLPPSLPLPTLPTTNSSLFGEATKKELPKEHIPEDIIEENGKVLVLTLRKDLKRT